MMIDETIAQPPSASDWESEYYVRAWGEGFFGVNEEGHVFVRPEQQGGPQIDVYAVVEELTQQGVSFPVTLRFPEVLRTRVRRLNEAFFTAMEETDYAAGYVGVYPVKVNQIRHVVEGVQGDGDSASFGLECGSKPELLAVLPYLTNNDRLLICNGYKSADMTALMLAFQRLGKNVMPVVEKQSEFDAILAEAEKHKMTPRLGIRVRLSAVGAGQWSESSGDDSKFGISMPDLLNLVERLEAAELYSALGLLHFHLGSQIDDIQALKMAVKEITRIYVSLHRRGHKIRYLDVGGGLGVNYESAPQGGGKGGVSYSIQEYANAIVYAAKEVCDAESVPVPTLVTENGRALVAHHALLVTEAIGSTSKPTTPPDFRPAKENHGVIHQLFEMAADVQLNNGETFSLGRLLEAYHDAVEERNNADTLFAYGYITLKEKALAERLFWTICDRINERIHAAKPHHVPAELRELNGLIVDQVLCDFSVFQSLTDYWSIGQRFPIMPIHRMNDAPTRRSRLVDLTCDSYGTIDEFVSPGGTVNYINLHAIEPGQRYFLGIFLTGAYQDSLSDHHNLFGPVTEAHVVADDSKPGGFLIRELIPGASVSTMLERVHYNPQSIAEAVAQLVRTGVVGNKLSEEDATEIITRVHTMLESSTYLGPET